MEYSLANSNKSKSSQTAEPSKYPQGYFKEKPCRRCGKVFTPKAPSEFYCCEECRQEAISNLENAIDYLKRATTIPKGSTPKQVEKVGTLTSEDIV